MSIKALHFGTRDSNCNGSTLTGYGPVPVDVDGDKRLDPDNDSVNIIKQTYSCTQTEFKIISHEVVASMPLKNFLSRSFSPPEIVKKDYPNWFEDASPIERLSILGTYLPLHFDLSQIWNYVGWESIAWSLQHPQSPNPNTNGTEHLVPGKNESY